MNTFHTEEWVPSLRPDPEKRTVTPADLRKRLMDVSVLIKDTKACRVLALEWPESATKLWTISAMDNRIADLMDQATAIAKALAGVSVVTL